MATLYGCEDNSKTQRVLASAKYGNTKLTVKAQSPPQDKFPLGMTPALVDGKTAVCGSQACQWRVGGEALKGQRADLHVETLQWLQFSDRQLQPVVLAVLLPSLSLAPFDKKSFEAAKSDLQEVLALLNKYLLSRTYLVGERISHADLAAAFDLLPAYQHILESAQRDEHANVSRWFMTVMNQPEVKAVVGELKLCTKAAQFDNKQWKDNQALIGSSGDAHAKPEGGGSKKQKKEKKASESEKAQAASEEMDPAEEAAAAEPKQTDPLAALPKGTFVMDDFKRVYSNEDTIQKALPHFWEKFDKENYSIWFCEYKYPEDLTLVFMSCNLIGGMFQRLEKLKKHAFASVCLFGENNNSTISGVWIWRGHDLVFEKSPDWQVDYESYTWKKLDADAAATKTLVNEYFAWEGKFGGKSFNQGKIFK